MICTISVNIVGANMQISIGKSIVAHCLRTANKNIVTQVCTKIVANIPKAKEQKHAETAAPADKSPKPNRVATNSIVAAKTQSNRKLLLQSQR